MSSYEEWEEPSDDGLDTVEWRAYFEAHDRFEYQYFKVLNLNFCGLARTLYKVAHSGRHENAIWRAIAKEFRKRGFSRRGLEKLRRLGLELYKANKTLMEMLEREHEACYDSDVPF